MKPNVLKLPKWLANPFFLKPTSLSILTSILLLSLAWLSSPYLIALIDRYAGLLDPAVLQLLLLACIAFACMLVVSALIFKWLFSLIGLPTVQMMVLQFKDLALWQQFVCYWASFALLLLGALLTLVAVF